MESFKVSSDSISTALIQNENWRVDAQDIAAMARSLPQTVSGHVSDDQVYLWAQAAAKVATPSQVASAITQAAGLGAKDIRTLIAESRGEYFPRDSKQELFERKNLERVTLPVGPQAERERIAVKMAVQYIIDTYDVKPLPEIMREMATPDTTRADGWLIGRPALVAEKNGEMHIFHVDLRTAGADPMDPNDNIPLCHYDLVAASINQDISHLHSVKVHANPTYLDAYVSLAKASTEAEKNLVAQASSIINSSAANLKIDITNIEKDPLLYQEIVAVGRENWGMIMRGEKPELKNDPKLTLEPAELEEYNRLARSFVAASQVASQAEDQAKEKGNKLISFMTDLGVDDNFTAPYNGSAYKKRDLFAAEEAAQYLENELGIDPAHLRDPVINVDRLQKAYLQTGGDVSAFQEYSKPNRKKIETVAHDMGINLDAFIERKMTVFVNPKTRGPIYEALTEIKESVKQPVQSLSNELAASKVMEKQPLLDSATQVKPQQSSMKV